MSNTDTYAATRQPSIPRTLLAVAAGLVFIFVTHLGMDVIMHATGVFPPWFQPMAGPMWLVPLGYRFVLSIGGCYLTARLAPSRPMFHALILGAIGTVLSIVGVASVWGKGPEYGPVWYAVVLVFMSFPCAWIGGKIRESQLR